MKLWGGRFGKELDPLAHQFNASLAFDVRLGGADVAGSMAWARGLERAGVLTADETEKIVAGLEVVQREWEAGALEFAPSDEDIHTAVERRLTEIVGSIGGKLHTGRSRNDQVATDLRLYLLNEMGSLGEALHHLQVTVVETAEIHLDVIMPGYTHLQQAQPVLFSHWLLSYFWKFQRDRERLGGVSKRSSVLPLGAGALAGSPLDVDRQALAADLGFEALAENSMDAVSDRDFVVEFLAWAALLQVHLSSLAEDLIIWSSHEYGFVELDEAYTTGSSLMPQKKNPDTLELIRGKTGRVVGHLTGLLTALKGLPSTYNKDLQEDKEALFDTLDTVAIGLGLVCGVIGTLRVNGDRMAAALDDTMLATDLADYLVDKGIPFRQSHHLVGQVVRWAGEKGAALHELQLKDYQAIHHSFDEDLYALLNFRQSVAARQVRGGTAPSAVRAQIVKARQALDS